MLGKLIKYELITCGRTFLPIYLAILLMSVITGFSINMEIFKISGVSMIILFGLFVSLVVLTIMIIIQRFRKNLLEDEGYLMFTLPVTSKELILSKYSVSLIYIILSSIVSLISFIMIILISNINNFSLDYFLYDLSILSNELLSVKSTLIYTIILIFVRYTIFILSIYLSLSMGQLSIFNKYRNIVAFLSFFIINIVLGKIYGLLSIGFNFFIGDYFMSNTYINESSSLNVLLSGFNDMLSPFLLFNIIVYIIFSIILFFGINYILDKKLNLE